MAQKEGLGADGEIGRRESQGSGVRSARREVARAGAEEVCFMTLNKLWTNCQIEHGQLESVPSSARASERCPIEV
jgi:hypothetical protein